MNRGRAAKKDYQRILKDMPTDKLHSHQSRYVPHLSNEKNEISHTVGFFNEKTLSPLNSSELPREHGSKHNQMTAYDKRITNMVKDQSLPKRIKTLQRSIDLNEKRRESSFDVFLKKEVKPIKDPKKETKSPYVQKITRQSLNIVPSKDRNNQPLYNSNRMLREGIQASYSYRGKFSSKGSLRAAQTSKTLKYSQEELLARGRHAQQEGKMALAIEYLNELLVMSPNNLQGNYLLGVSYMSRNEFVRGLKHFDKIADLKPDYSKNIYVLAAIACKKLLLYQQSLKRLTKCIGIFPDNADAYLYRAKLRLKEAKIAEALADFQVAGRLQPGKAHSCIGQGDCYLQLKDPAKALTLYQESLSVSPPITVYLRIAECHNKLNMYSEAMQAVNKLLSVEPRNIQGLYLKAVILSKLKKTSDANMLFEQVLCLNDPRFTSKTIEQMVVIKIAERDFYSAQHILERETYLDVDLKLLEKVKVFTQAVVFLMKRKYQEGIQMIEGLAKRNRYFDVSLSNNPIDDFLKPLANLYVAFGYFSLDRFKESLKHYELYIKILQSNSKSNSVMQSALYNMELCQAMIALNKKNLSLALRKFEAANKILPHKIEPFFFRVVTMVQLWDLQGIHYWQQDQKLLEVVEILSQGISQLKEGNDTTSSNMYFLRSVVYGVLSMWNQCLSDIDIAIQKSQDNVPKYFYVRGSAFACCQSYKQAIHDVSISLKINSNYSEAYLLRSKCLQLEGETNEAFIDLQRYITLKPEDPMIHKYAGHLLFENGAFEDSILAYAHGDIDTLRDLDIYSTRAKAYLLLGQFQESIQDLKVVCTNSTGEENETDLELVQVLLELNRAKNSPGDKTLREVKGVLLDRIEKNVEGNIFKSKELWMLLGAVNAFLHNFSEAVSNFETCIKLKQSNLKEATIENEAPDLEELEEFYIYCNQMKFNISVCYLAGKNLNKAFQVCEQITTDRNNSSQMATWLNIIKAEICGVLDQETAKATQKQGLQVFSLKNKLSRYLQPVTLDLKIACLDQIKLCLSFPKVEPPQINPNFDRTLLPAVDYNDVQSKPQAPWIRKSDNCIMFTSTIQVYDNLDLLTQQRTKRNQDQRDNSIMFENEFYNDNHNEKSILGIEQLKQHLKLEDKVQERLNKLLKQ